MKQKLTLQTFKILVIKTLICRNSHIREHYPSSLIVLLYKPSKQAEHNIGTCNSVKTHYLQNSVEVASAWTIQMATVELLNATSPSTTEHPSYIYSIKETRGSTKQMAASWQPTYLSSLQIFYENKECFWSDILFTYKCI